jgi:hypothetical protein
VFNMILSIDLSNDLGTSFFYHVACFFCTELERWPGLTKLSPPFTRYTCKPGEVLSSVVKITDLQARKSFSIALHLVIMR